MKQVFLRVLAIVVLILGVSACSGSQLGQEPDREELGAMVQFLHQTDDGMWVLIPTSAKSTPPAPETEPAEEEDSKTTTGDVSEPEPATPTGYVLVNGAIVHSVQQGGSYLIESRDVKSCEKGLCADFSTVPWASTVLNQPGYFSLTVPNHGKAMFITVTYQSSSETKVIEEYVGIVEKRIDRLTLIF